MIERLVQARVLHSVADGSQIDEASERAPGLSLTVYAMQLILAYEWLLSGIDKLVDPNFSTQLPIILRQSTLFNRYHWYSSFLKQLVLPHQALLAASVVTGELAIGVVLVVSGALWIWRPFGRVTRWMGWAACLALAGAVLLSLNYFFQQGTPLPWIDKSQAFSPAVGIDMLIALLSLPLLAANLRNVRAA